MTDFATLYKAAQDADDDYSAAVRAAGYKSRWEYDHKVLRAPSPLRDAYDAKVAADLAMHAWWRAKSKAT
jgi:hypothetical protein